MTSPPEIAELFAKSLDEDDFERARQYLSDEACYDIGDETLRGPDAILASYRESTERAHRLLDGIRYESIVNVDEAGQVSIRYLDHISHAGVSFTHQCCQHLGFDEESRINHIRHEDLPGEPERLKAFFEQVGLTAAFAGAECGD